jgi:hypothetical protein
MKQNDAKSQKYFAVSRAILEIIETSGESLLSHSLISRHSKVSRAWIYEYMGKERSDLVNVAAEVFASFFARANTAIEVHSKDELKKLLVEGLDVTFLNIKNEPVIIKLFYRFRGTETAIGDVIKKYEKHWLDFMSANFVKILKVDSNQALIISRAILTLRLGFSHQLATSSNKSKVIAEAKESLDLITSQLFL